MNNDNRSSDSMNAITEMCLSLTIQTSAGLGSPFGGEFESILGLSVAVAAARACLVKALT